MSSNETANTSHDDSSSSPPSSSDTSRPTGAYMGRVKWFNNRAGYGFVTVLNGDRKDSDVFVHHSGVKVDHEQYRYLVQGEYVCFNVTRSDSKDHKWQATQVRGIMGEKLMCETHWDMRKEREDRARDNEGSYRPTRNPRYSRRGGEGPRSSTQYGGGVREDTEGFRLAKGGRHQVSPSHEREREL